jgi:uncharacterized protein
MAKVLLLLLIVVIVYVWWKKMHAHPRRAAPEGRGAAPQAMLKCARCGVHFPAAEAIMRDGCAYCSPPHAEEDAS